ncbi:MAG: PIN domain-containing protein [Candidatus Jordarchaeaceae archaeon]
MILVMDSSFLLSLIEGSNDTTEVWGKAKSEGNRIFVPTVSIAFFASESLKMGRGEYIDLILAVLRQTLNVSIVICDVGIAIDAGRIMNAIPVGVEEAFILAVANLRKAEGVLTTQKNKYYQALENGLIKRLL